VKVKKPVSRRKMTRKTYATGEVKYAQSSRFAMVQTALIV
jgi:hypothetical protein